MSEETRVQDLSPYYSEAIVQSLVGANGTLEEEVKRLRKTVTTLRTVNGILRRENSSLRRQAELAQQNDEVFKHICESGFGASVTSAEGGLLEADVVETSAIDEVEASSTTASS